MTFQNPDAAREYEFWARQVTNDHDQSAFVTLSTEDVLSAHFHLVDFFSEEGVLLGGVGPRDINLLQSTVHRQYAGYGGHDKWTKQFDVIATLFYGLICNHPFHDANKRRALLCMLYHLERVGKCLNVSDDIIEDFTVAVADHKLDKYQRKTGSAGAQTDRTPR